MIIQEFRKYKKFVKERNQLIKRFYKHNKILKNEFSPLLERIPKTVLDYVFIQIISLFKK